MLKISLKKWAFLFIIILSDLLIALKTSIEFFYFFFWFLVTVVVISLAWLLIQYLGAGLYLERRVVSRIDEDEALEIETVIRNKGILPVFDFVLEDYLPCAVNQEKKKALLVGYLGFKSSVKIKYSCLCPLRGRYNLGPFFIYIFDPFGIFFLRKVYFVNSELYVYPKTFSIRKFPLLKKGSVPWFGIETSHVSGDEHDFYGIREYRYGDPIRKIHWVSTARKDMLIVKQFQHQVFYRATILFNLRKEGNFGIGKESVAEYTIKIAASVAKHLIERNVSLEIIAHAGEVAHIPFNKGPEHLEDILKFLAAAQAESRISLGEIFEEFALHIPGDSNLVVIMTDNDWDDLSAILSLGKRNISVLPLILNSSSFLNTGPQQQVNPETVKLPEGMGFDFTPIFFSRGDILEEAFVKHI